MIANFRRLKKITPQKCQWCPFRLMKCGGELMPYLACVPSTKDCVPGADVTGDVPVEL